MEVWRWVEGTVEAADLAAGLAAVSRLPGAEEQDRRQLVAAAAAALLETGPGLLHRLEQIALLVWERLNTGHWAEVWPGWTRTYRLVAAARVQEVARLVLARGDEGDQLLREVVRLCDMGILLGGAGGGPVMNQLLETIAQHITDHLAGPEEDEEEVPVKVPRLSPPPEKQLTWRLPLPRPLTALPRLACPSIPSFLSRCLLPGAPHLLTDCLSDWPALAGPRRWTPDRLLRLAGPRTVPVELGSQYTETDWTQRLMTVEQFVSRHLAGDRSGPTGYLAQHQLLDQVPRLMADLEVPDYCYTGKEEDVDVNVWIGPGGTVSPAHNDPKHNLLCQVAGTKYVALFLPDQAPNLYPIEEAMMGNSSRVDLDRPDLEQFPRLAELEGQGGLLRAGEMLYIPPGVWHYVRSLEQSFSVSFWWQ